MATQITADTADFPLQPPGAEPPPPFSSLVQIDVAALSHRGKVRPNNEDHFLVAQSGRYLDVRLTNLPDGAVPGRAEETAHSMIVADGMGGAEGGEIASRLAIRTLVNLVLEVPDWILRLGDEAQAEELMRRARRRYREVDAALSQEARRDPKLAQMGTTMTLGHSVGDDLFVVHVGDSRAYLFRRGRLWQLTSDQTMAQMLVNLGEITREQAASHRLRHVLTHALGRHGGEVRVEVQRLKLADGDCLLLCTDGLNDMVAEARIAEALGRAATAETACRELVDLALDGGGRDNVTVIVARYRLPAAGPTENEKNVNSP
jgi:protein phosphatase